MNKIAKYQVGYAVSLLVVLSLACSSQVSFIETPLPVNAETLVAGTMAVYTKQAQNITSTPMPTMKSIPAASTPEGYGDTFGEVFVYTVVDNVNLRVNPGLLFQVSRVLPKNTKLTLLGLALGEEWLNVRNDEGVIGWVNSNVVLMAYDGPRAPLVEPANVILVTGKVLTELGTPVSGIGFAVYQGDRRTDAKTDETGQFYAYLPNNMSGIWTVGYSSVSCTSNTMDANCNCIGGKCGSASPESVFVELPQQEVINFVWK